MKLRFSTRGLKVAVSTLGLEIVVSTRSTGTENRIFKEGVMKNSIHYSKQNTAIANECEVCCPSEARAAATRVAFAVFRPLQCNILFLVSCDSFREYSPSIKKVSQLDLLIKIYQILIIFL